MDSSGRNLRLAVSLFGLAAGMVMLAFASAPLYRLFCQATGFAGATTRAQALPTTVSGRVITVRFNADVSAELPWKFQPGVKEMAVHVGEQALTYYTARNLSGVRTAGHSTYNVVPESAGPYFAKMQCFCFQNQPLGPGQEANLPVSFFIDPAILDDPAMADVRSITLSYTFFPATSPLPNP